MNSDLIHSSQVFYEPSTLDHRFIKNSPWGVLQRKFWRKAKMRYGKILAEYYDLMSPDIEKDELSFWMKHIGHIKGTVLEMGCGTGRILIPFLKRKIKIIGIDASQDMLNKCREKCRKLNLKTVLKKQSMQTFKLNQKLSFVFIPDGSLSFVITNEEMIQTFKNVYNHLLPGSPFMFDIMHLHSHVGKPERGWQGDWQQADDNLIYSKRFLTEYDPKTHVQSRLLIIEKFVNGSLAGSEENLGKLRFYTIDEISGFLHVAGFKDVKPWDWLSEKKVKKDSYYATFRCIKPA
jgi:SAM-dependent methyltransferase